MVFTLSKESVAELSGIYNSRLWVFLAVKPKHVGLVCVVTLCPNPSFLTLNLREVRVWQGLELHKEN